MSRGIATVRPPSPTSTRRSASSDTARIWPVSTAPCRSRRSSDAASSAVLLSCARPEPGVSVSTSPATSATIIITATISSRVKPAHVSEAGRRVPIAWEKETRSLLDAGNVGCIARAALAAVGAIGDDLIRREVLDRRAVLVGIAPRVGRHATALHVGAIPDRYAGRTLGERVEPLRRGRVAASVEEEQVERRAEAFDLQLRGLGARVGQVAEHARSGEADDQADDRQHDEKLDQRVARTGCGDAATDRLGKRGRGNGERKRCAHVASSVMLRSALMIDTMSAPMTTLTMTIVTGPIAPISRSSPMPNFCS